jgi:UPF0042 nucleotide-binding protein
VRSENLLEDFFSVISELRRFVPLVQVVYLDAADSALVRRFEATRRRHPLAGEAPIHEGVLLERELMERLRRVADVHIDTTRLSPTELRARLLADLGWISATPSLVVSSFGFKYGAPQDCDYLVDVRFLPNPNYEPELHSLSGRDEPVRNYLDGFPETRAFLERLENLLALVIPLYERTGKNPIHVAVGCTGGRHRSVAIAEHLGTCLSALGQRVLIRHRDCDREPPR